MLKCFLVVLLLLLAIPQTTLAIDRTYTEATTVDKIFLQKNKALAKPPSVLEASCQNDVQEELVNIVKNSGQIPAKEIQDQLAQALVLHVKTISTLRSLPIPVSRRAVQVSGYYAAGDGWGGPTRYWIDSGVPGTYIDNGGSIIVPSSGDGSGAWIWSDPPKPNVKLFGARGDGSSDDIDKITATINSLPKWPNQPAGGEITFPDGIYMVSSPVLAGLGVRLVGDTGNYTTIIKALPGFSGEAVVLFRNDLASDWSNSGSGIENIRIIGNNQHCAGLVAYSPRDGSRFEDLYISGIGDGYNAMKITGHPNSSTGISQSLILNNVILSHANSTATADTLLIDSLQESSLTNVKAFGGYPNVNANAVPIRIKNSRSVTLIGPTAAQTTTNGIVVESDTRASVGITIVGPTFEDVLGTTLVSNGTSVYGNVSLSSINPRYEGTIGTGATLTYTSSSFVETLEKPCAISTGSQYNRLVLRNTSDFTDSSGLANQPYFFGIAPKTYNEQVTAADRTINASNTTLEELANVLGSLINDLRDRGIVK